MILTKQEVGIREREIIDAINNMIIEIHVPICESITSIINTRRKIGIKERKIPVISVTLNNKINEISAFFKAHNISFFAVPMEEYEFTGISIIGEAIRDELIEYLFEATNIMNIYIDIVDQVIEDNKSLIESIRQSKFKKMKFGIVNHFRPDVIDEMLDYNWEGLKLAETYMNSYVVIDELLFNYDFKKNLINTLMSHFKRNEDYSKDNIIYIVSNYVVPDLIALGLNDLIPDLYSEILNTYGVSFNSNPSRINVDFLRTQNVITYVADDDFTL